MCDVSHPQVQQLSMSLLLKRGQSLLTSVQSTLYLSKLTVRSLWLCVQFERCSLQTMCD